MVVLGLSLLIASARRRARCDWTYEVRLMVVLGYLDWLESPQRGLELSEVRLTAPFEPSISNELLLARPHRCGTQPILFRLHESMGDRRPCCTHWYEDGTSLLLASDDFGAVLHGPDGRLLGQLVQDGGVGAGRVGSIERR
jgi:hypothetical protein